MNNRAAEHLARGDLANAYAYAREAVVQDPAFPVPTTRWAWSTSGAAWSAQAERAYRYALEHRRHEHGRAGTTWRSLLDAQQRAAEAAPLRERLAPSGSRAAVPVTSTSAVRRSRPVTIAAAREHLLREMRRDPDYHEFHFWLALALVRAGRCRPSAREHLTPAMNNSTTRTRPGALCVQAAAPAVGDCERS